MEEGENNEAKGGLTYQIFAEVAIEILYKPKLKTHNASNAPPLMHFGSKKS